MAVAERMFPVLSQRPEERFLLGISMGGHGAFKLAMEYPQRFHAAAACSSPIDVVETMRLLEAGRHPGGHELYDAYGGSQAYSGGVGDVMAMAAQRVREGCPLPKLWLCWGDQDHARFEDQVTVEKFRALGIPLETRVGHGGHDFYTWDPMLEDILDWMLEEGQANGLD